MTLRTLANIKKNDKDNNIKCHTHLGGGQTSIITFRMLSEKRNLIPTRVKKETWWLVSYFILYLMFVKCVSVCVSLSCLYNFKLFFITFKKCKCIAIVIDF